MLSRPQHPDVGGDYGGYCRQRARAVLSGRRVKREASNLRKLFCEGRAAGRCSAPLEPESRSQRQRKGYDASRGDRQLIPDTVADVEEHVAQAVGVQHPFVSRDEDEDDDLCAAVRWVLGFGSGPEIDVERQRRVKVLRQVAARLEGVDAELEALKPAHIRGMVQPVSPSLIAALAEAVGAPDVEQALGFVCGFECVGDIPPSGWWPAAPDDERPRVDISDLDHAAWHDSMEATIAAEARRADRAADVQAVWDRTCSERDAGLVHGPFARSEMDAAYGEGFWRAMRRFGILQNGKVRACDNARRSRHNAATRRAERMQCETADFPARVAAAFRRAQRRPSSKWASRAALEMLSGTDDLADAYRHIPNATPQYSVFALWRPADPEEGWPGGVVYFTLPGFNFGLASAVPQFNRFPELMQAVARRLFGICSCHFFDDFNVTEPAFSAASGQWALRQLLDIVGFPFAKAKAVDVGPVVVFLGVESDFSELTSRGVVLMRVRPDRVARLVARCRDGLPNDGLAALYQCHN